MLSTPQTEIDLGTIEISKPHKMSFTIRNNATYTITPGVRTGCSSCTTAHLTPSAIPAGGTAILQATFTPTARGQQTKSISVSYLPNSGNVPKTQFMTFRFKANVV